MRNNIIISILLCTVCLTSCQQDIQETGNYIGKHISVSAQAGEDTSTRTTLNGFQTQWVAGDQIGVFSPQSDDSNHPHTATTDAAVSPFNGTMVWSKDPHDFYAYYPYVDGAFTYTAVPVSLPAVQTQTAANSSEHIAALDFMVASPLTGIEVGGEVSFQFSHLFTLLEFRVVGSGEISMIEFATDASANLAFYGGTIDISQMKPTGDAPFAIAYPSTIDSSVSLTLANPATLTDDSETTSALYMMINPIDLANQQLTVTATINGTPKTITANGFRFERGRKYVLVAVPEEDLLIIAKTEYEFEKEGGTLTFDVEHNVDFDIMIDESAQSWIKPIETRALETTTLSFSISAYEEEGERTGTIVLSKGNVKQTITVKQKGIDLIALQREALIIIYNALGGDNWTTSINWCSDKPVGEWYGITTNEEGFVISLSIMNIGLNGVIPSEIGNFYHLKHLQIGAGSFGPEDPRLDAVKGEIPKEIGNLINLEYLNLFYRNMLAEGVIPKEIFNCSKLTSLSIFGQFTGGIPEEICNCTELELIYFDNAFNLGGTIPQGIGNLTKLRILNLSWCGLSGRLPASLSNCKKMTNLNLYRNNLIGEIPKEWNNIDYNTLTDLRLGENRLTGELPATFVSTEFFKYNWGDVVIGNSFNDFEVDGPYFSVIDIDGNVIKSETEYSDNRYTILYQYHSDYHDYDLTMEEMKEIYSKYRGSGVTIIGSDWIENSEIKAKYLPWRNFSNFHGENIYGENPPFKYHYYPGGTAGECRITAIDTHGKVVYSDILNNETISVFLAKAINGAGSDLYASTDYSADGKVNILQTSTAGNGIDIVLMGDAYSDRLIADGTYEQTMRKAMDFFFTEEPYKSHRDMFNVYAVNVVSKNEVYDAYSVTALNGYFGGGTLVGGSDAKCVEYAQKAITADRLDDALIVVMMNSESYGGTCYMYYPTNGDYGRGLSIAYFPIGTNDGDFESLLHHEAGGHGFAKLADEYAYEFMGGIPTSEITSTKQMEPYGWWRNVDFTNNPEQVKWAKYLTDNRYAQEGLGIYEGALTYWTGAYRPTDYSIMRYNTGGFNAPSREAIYYRIHKLAYGSGWTYNYEAFVSYDAINRTFAANAARARQAVARTRPFKPQTPPVVIPHSWREAK